MKINFQTIDYESLGTVEREVFNEINSRFICQSDTQAFLQKRHKLFRKNNSNKIKSTRLAKITVGAINRPHSEDILKNIEENTTNSVNNNGITLVALAITIIILIILSLVTINLTIGKNGLVTRAKEMQNYMINAVRSDEKAINVIIEEMESELNEIENLPIEEKYTVTYTDGVEGKIVFPDQCYEGLKLGENIPKFEFEEGYTEIINGKVCPIREGYTFMGWAPATNDIVSKDIANENGEIFYIATWQKN